MMKTKYFLSVCSVLILIGLSVLAENSAVDPAYLKEIQKWREDRVAGLKTEDGWLTLVGLFWLKEGENKLGSDPSGNVVLPSKAPKAAGTLWLEKGQVRIEVAPNSGITHDGQPIQSLALQPDSTGEPTVLNLGTLSFYVIKRVDRLGIRVKDKENPDRAHFAGLDYYPIDPKWSVQAKLEAYNPSKTVPILNIIGLVDNMPSPGALVFSIDGQTYRLDALKEEGSKDLFIIFADQTSGKETYGAGRYLYAAEPGPDGKVIVDFNKAYNPPCAFTSFATCPLPPKQNRLPLRVQAGEKKYSHSAH